METLIVFAIVLAVGLMIVGIVPHGETSTAGF